MSENKYREYLSDDAFYRQYLNNEGEPDGLSSFSKTGMGIGAAVGMAAGSMAAFKKGHLQKPIATMIESMGRFRRSSIQDGVSQFRAWTNDAGWDSTGSWLNPIDKLTRTSRQFKKLGSEYMPQVSQIRSERMKRLGDSTLSDHQFELMGLLGQRNNILNREFKEIVKRQGIQDPQQEALLKQRLEKELDDGIKSLHNVTADQQANALKRTGHKQLTVQEAIDKKILGQEDMQLLQSHIDLNTFGSNFKHKVLDQNVLLNKAGNVVDTRDFHHAYSDTMHSIANDFTAPFIRINPVKMFYLDNVISMNKAPKFAVLGRGDSQPVITGNLEGPGKDLLFSNGRVLDLGQFDHQKGAFNQIESNGYLIAADGVGSPITRMMRSMFNLSTSQFEKPKGIVRRAWYETARVIDFGFQDEPIRSSIEAGNPVSFYSAPMRKLIHGFNIGSFRFKGIKPYGEGTKRWPLERAFADDNPGNKYVFMRSYKKPKDGLKAFGKQFVAGRNSPEDVTTATFFPFGFFERLNSTLNQMGLGLSTQNMGSATSIFGNLITRRIAPLLAGIEGYKYANYEFENMFGEEFEDKFARFYANTHVGSAGIREKIGFTDWAKETTNLMPGVEFISELPVPILTTEGFTPVQLGDALMLNKTQEETAEWYQSGLEKVRGGRYWEFGNCVHPDTPIQLADGRLVPAKDVQVNDQVLTHEGTTEKVLQVTIREMDQGEYAPEIYIEGFPEAIITTDNHPYLAVKHKPCPSSSVVDCRPDRQMTICQNQVYPAYCSHQQEWEAQWTLARYLEESDYLAYPRLKFQDLITEIDGIPLNEETGYFVGIFLAEGNISNWNNQKAYGIETIHHEDETDITERLTYVAETYFNDHSSKVKIKEGKALRWRNGKRVISKWIQDLLYTSRQKLFPTHLDQYPEGFAQGLLKGIFEGDGHLSKNGKDSLVIALTSARMEHIVSVRNLLFAFGFKNTVTNHSSNGHTSYRIQVSGDAAKIFYQFIDYRKPCPTTFKLTGTTHKSIYIDEDYVYLKIKSITESGYFGTVYDYEIENAHSFCGITVVLHNTPFTGGTIKNYQPNWYNRITSEYEYTDTLWGSKEEYWQNHLLPTPRHPLAPIRHFITDPYHWEKKHYEDRPYPMTGGIPEIEEFPLFGPALNATVGRLLKPGREMHVEEWNNPGSYLRRPGFTMAAELGLYDHKLGGQTGPSDGTGPTEYIEGTGPLGPPQKISASYGSAGNYQTEGREQPNPLAYVTSSGNVQMMHDVSIGQDEINRQLKDRGLQATGHAQKWEPGSTNINYGTNNSEASSPGSLHATLAGMHSNITSFGGFYGWMTTIPFSQDHEYEPRMATSIQAYGYQRSFWDREMGNLGGDMTEIYRRFHNRDSHKNYINPIKNTMASWLPGNDYFIDFQHGDPYVKVDRGEMRLPGEAYEKLYGIPDPLDFEANINDIAGKDSERIMRHFLGRGARHDLLEDPDDLSGAHKRLRRDLIKRELIHEEQETIHNPNMNITGVYEGKIDNQHMQMTMYDMAQTGSYVNHAMSEQSKLGEDAILLIKSINNENFSKRQYNTGHYDALNFFMHESKTPAGYLMYVNEEDPTAAPHIFTFNANTERFGQAMQPLIQARNNLYQMLDDKAIGRGDFYDPVDRLRILGDVAPYSNEFKDMKSQMRDLKLTEEERKEVTAINERAIEQRKPLRHYDYRFKTASVETQQVTVRRRLDNNMFVTEEYPDNPIKLAGLYVPTGKDDPDAHQASDLIDKVVKPGQKLRITTTDDERNFYNQDTYKSISAVVGNGHVRNLNQRLIERGLAKEKEDDYSAAAVHARFSDNQIAFGSMWESFAHMDTPFHTKLLQVRSPLEDYERRQVFGKDWQDWASPISDFIVPWYQNWISKNPVATVGTGMMMGYFFGQAKNMGQGGRFGRYAGAAIGGATAGIGVGYRLAYEGITGDTWIPKRRRDQHDLEEYMDILDYVKNESLYRQYSDAALEKEGFDVDQYLMQNSVEGEERKERLNELGMIKRRIKTHQDQRDLDFWIKRARAVLDNKDLDVATVDKAINGAMEEIRNTRYVEELTPLAAQAVYYHGQAESTMYGYQPGDPLQNVLTALPKTERRYVTQFMDAPEEERDRILDIVPDYTRRILQSTWGREVDERPDLEEYFQQHELPDADWLGWDARSDMDDIRIKMVKHEGLDQSEFDIWQDDRQRTAQISNDILPDMNKSTNPSTVRKQLRDILEGSGLQNVRVDVTERSKPGMDVDMELEHDMREEVIREMNRQGEQLFK